MEMRVLGNTGLAVSRIGLGLGSLGRPGYINLKHGEDRERQKAKGKRQKLFVGAPSFFMLPFAFLLLP